MNLGPRLTAVLLSDHADLRRGSKLQSIQDPTGR